MAAYIITTDKGTTLDAKLEVERSTIVLHSRGGSKGKNETNPDYSVALRLLLRRIADEEMAIKGAWVDSTRVQDLPLSAREILGKNDVGATPDELFKRMSARMQKVGHPKDALPTKGNSNKRIKLEFLDDLSPSVIARALKIVPLAMDLRSQQRLPAGELDKVTPEHIWNAIQQLMNGYSAHGFGQSTDFDLIADSGARLPPKAVFSIAATEALGFKVMPKHFTGGDGSACFRILKAAGYVILPKQIDEHTVPTFVSTTEEQWTEGSPKLMLHVRKERGAGLAAAKKQEFRRLHGKLRCEKCDIDPVLAYGTQHGEACIEVHHRATQVQDMTEGHVTKLEDLQCLCANCHRLVHRLLKTQINKS